jgi:O-antigen ligase
MRRFLFLAFLAVLFFSHFFTLLTKFSIGYISTWITASTSLIALVGILYMLGLGFLAAKKTTIRGVNTLDVLIAIYSAVLFIQVFNPHLPHLLMGLRGLYESGSWILSYLSARVLVTEEGDTSKLAFVIALTSVLGVFYGLFTLYVGIGVIERAFVESAAREDLLFVRRSVGTLGSPFSFGLMCAIGYAAILTINIRKGLSAKSGLLAGGSVVLLGGVLIAGSRSVMLGIFLSLMGLLTLILFRRVNRETTSLASRRNAPKYAAFLLLASVVGYMLLSAYFPFQRERVASILDLKNEANVHARVEIWRELLPYFVSNPMGYGTGSLGGPTYRYGTIIGEIRVADNQYLESALEHGFIGIVLILAIFLMILIYYLRVHKLDRSSVSLAALLASLIILAAGLGAPSLKAYPSNLFFGALVGGFSSSYSRLMLGRNGSFFHRQPRDM